MREATYDKELAISALLIHTHAEVALNKNEKNDDFIGGFVLSCHDWNVCAKHRDSKALKSQSPAIC